ncbi:glycerate kinase [Fredinandcohnia salidurans]|uniref:Glycerate kinase n=1 Tax=Fredinandcohnia salidurans TaxID=2595041 RepID=A0ABW4MUC1_9BACI
MRILVAPDSFKGSLSSKSVGEIIKSAFISEIPDVLVDVLPMADGGEGTTDALLFSTVGEKVKVEITGPMGNQTEAFYGLLNDSQTVVIEVASIAGYTKVPDKKRDPFYLTSFGIGECVTHALDSGYRKFIFCLGGSSTNDAGIGLLQALGVNFENIDRNKLAPFPYVFDNIEYVDYSNVDKRIWESDFRVACDVENPLCGVNGATYVFGPQKGVKDSELNKLDNSIKRYAELIESHLQVNLMNMKGSGAAGGLGFALLSIGAKIESGAKLIAKHLNLEEKIMESEWLITGEGRTDEQTLQGKLPFEVANIAKNNSVPTILISGSLEGDLEQFYTVFESIHSISSGPLSLEESIKNTEKLLHHKARNIARLLKFAREDSTKIYSKEINFN